MDKPVKILFLAASPDDTNQLRLDEEIRGIDQALRQAEFRDKFDIEQQWAVRVVDLQGYLLRHQPDIVHFSGHGSAAREIILEDGDGNSQPVSGRALGQLFSVFKDHLRCVVLNACYSEPQAQAIAKHIDCVVGMSKTIGDAAAISFAVAFYQALGFGKDIKTAFDLGCVQIDLENLNEQDTPKLLTNNIDPKALVLAPALSNIGDDAMENANPEITRSESKLKDFDEGLAKFAKFYRLLQKLR
ncbi:MAG: CHAT domain-containing protein [bacterium]